MMDILMVGVILDALSCVSFLVLCYMYVRLRRQKESEYYTDYVHKNLILRIYKPEFEYQAIGKVSLEKILDKGTFSQFYNWCLIEV